MPFARHAAHSDNGGRCGRRAASAAAAECGWLWQSPPILALPILPPAVLAFEGALRTRSGVWATVTGCAAAIVDLSNAFGAAALVAVVVCLVVVYEKGSLRVAFTGVVTFWWVLPRVSPALILKKAVGDPLSPFRYLTASGCNEIRCHREGEVRGS